MSNSNSSPIVLFVYNRLNHTRRTVEALQNNLLARESDLFVFADAAKSEAQADSVFEVRRFIRQIEGFKSVTIVERETSIGLAGSIIDGVTSVVNRYGRIIVLEDDMVTSPYFLTYMNEALEKYVEDDRVVSIHGYVYPLDQSLPETFFLPGADCWGWATWRRGWECFNPAGQFLLDELKRRDLIRDFDYNGAYSFSGMLKSQINGKNDSWAIRWYASAFLAGKLTLYPGRSLVHNIGNDNSGTHRGETARFDGALTGTPIALRNIAVAPSAEARQAFENFFRRSQSGVGGLLHKVFSLKGITAIKLVAKNWLPPAMFRWARRIGLGGVVRFEGNFATWEEARARCTGYDSNRILTKVLDATLRVKRGEAAFERDSVLFDEIEYAWPVLAGLMWAATRNGGRLNVLDFGGALGSSYFQNHKFLKTLPEVRWNVVEQAHFVVAGRAHIQDDSLRFYMTIEEALNETQPNVVLLSSVLQYLESPFDIIKQVSCTDADFLILDRTPFSMRGNDQLLIQHVPPSIYAASYPIRVFSQPEFMRALDADWRLIASNLSPESHVQAATGFEFTFQGMLLERRR